MTPEEQVRGRARDILEYAGMELVHLEMKQGAAGYVVRLFIDRPGGVTLDDCALVSRQLSASLDVDDPLPHRYTLEVSSPGLDRPLFNENDYKKFAGRRVRLSTVVPIDGRRNFVGRLDGFAEGVVRLVLESDQLVSIPLERVAKARLEVEIGRSQGPAGMRGRNA